MFPEIPKFRSVMSGDHNRFYGGDGIVLELLLSQFDFINYFNQIISAHYWLKSVPPVSIMPLFPTLETIILTILAESFVIYLYKVNKNVSHILFWFFSVMGIICQVPTLEDEALVFFYIKPHSHQTQASPPISILPIRFFLCNSEFNVYIITINKRGSQQNPIIIIFLFMPNS